MSIGDINLSCLGTTGGHARAEQNPVAVFQVEGGSVRMFYRNGNLVVESAHEFDLVIVPQYPEFPSGGTVEIGIRKK